MESKQKAPQAGGNPIQFFSQDKDKDFRTQMQIIYLSLKERPKTMLQVSIESGILRANICRRVADLRKSGSVQVVRKGPCPYTRAKAGFYTTDPALFVNSNLEPTLF